jgi:hypothetical protein
MQRLGLIDHRLQRNRVCDELVVNNGLFLICGVGSKGKAWKIVQFKLRRMLYDEILRMNEFSNWKSARILGYCLNVMGSKVYKGQGAYGRDYRALHRAVIAWTQRNYLIVRRKNLDIAEACLIGTITYDASETRLVKTFTKGLETEPARDYLSLAQ